MMEARHKAAMATHDFKHIKKVRSRMVQVANEQLNGNQTLCNTHETAKVIAQTPMPRPPMHTVDSVSAGDLHVLFTPMVDWIINAVRTPPAGGAKAKYKKREGAAKVK